MSEKPQAVAIGAFVVGAVLIALVTLLYLLGSGFGDKQKVVMVFDSSVTGLNVGAPLALRGVKIGEVTKIELVLDSDNVELIMLVEAEFDPSIIRLRGMANDNLTEELLARGLRAQLNTQSLLTGLLYVQLDFHPNSELKLANIDSPYFQFPTVPTELERITKKLQDIDIGELVDDVSSMTNSVDNFVSSQDFQNLPARLNDSLQSLSELSEQLQDQLASTGPRLDIALDEATQTVASTNAELPELLDLVEENLRSLDAAITSIESGMTGVDELVSPDSETVYQLNQALKEAIRAGRSLQSLADTLEQQPEALIRGRSNQ
ncbi:MAG: MlaD family protein [Pseudomonadota bacterium]